MAKKPVKIIYDDGSELEIDGWLHGGWRFASPSGLWHESEIEHIETGLSLAIMSIEIHSEEGRIVGKVGLPKFIVGDRNAE